MKQNKCALLVVEGIKTEPSIFKEIFEKYGYIFVNMNEIDNYECLRGVSSGKTVFLVQGKQNRLNHLISEFNEYEILSQRYGIEEIVAYNYIVYDFDYVKKEKIDELQIKFSSPQEGEMLLSNPCVEVIADNVFSPYTGRSSGYKKYINKQITESGYTGITGKPLTTSYIVENFEELMIKHIKRNCEYFKSRNVSEHPSLLINYVMNTNIPNEDENFFEFHYLATVIYVAFAELEGLTREIDNAQKVIDFFNSHR